MNAQPSNSPIKLSVKQRLLTALIFISIIAGLCVWGFSRRYQVDSELVNGYKTESRALTVLLVKELENEPQNWGSADLLAKALVKRLQERGYTVRLVVSETTTGRTAARKIASADSSGPDAYEAGSGPTPLESEALDSGPPNAGVLRVFLASVSFQKRTRNVISEVYGLELLNPDRSTAWKANLTYRRTILEPAIQLWRYSFGTPEDARWEVLPDKAIAQMQQQGVLKPE